MRKKKDLQKKKHIIDIGSYQLKQIVYGMMENIVRGDKT